MRRPTAKSCTGQKLQYSNTKLSAKIGSVYRDEVLSNALFFLAASNVIIAA